MTCNTLNYSFPVEEDLYAGFTRAVQRVEDGDTIALK